MQGLFDMPMRGGREQELKLAKRVNAKTKVAPTALKGGGTLMDRISAIKQMVDTHLGQYAKDSIIIDNETTLVDYIDKSIENGVISIDTETTGLNPMLDELVGICIYTPNMPTAYIPVNHKSYITQLKVENQLPIDILNREFSRLVGLNIVMFNATFDMRFLYHGIGVKLRCTWDCYLASRVLNENEPQKGLKKLHQKYILNGEEDAFKFSELFKGITFDLIPISTGYLYASHDAIITYELYEYQKQFLDPNEEKCKHYGLEELAWVFNNIEMPCVDVVATMEDNGITFDMDYCESLSVKYNKQLEDNLNEFYSILNNYSKAIENYRISNPSAKLDNPINIGSPAQIQILLYDILGLKLPEKVKNQRGTGEENLSQLNHPIVDAILKYRNTSKLLSTYVDKLPLCVNPNDGRIHCNFNQYGADTGRMSSSNPNMQNIPSHNKEIRKMFTAADGYVLMSSDFSQQEPKCLAALCRQQGDSQMYDTFMAGKDLYSEIASKAFNVSYEDCLEFNSDGTTNKEGKNRRTQAKSILLGVLYGRGTPSIAEQLGCSVEKAQDIKDSVFRGFPAIKQFEESSLRMARECGYVTTVCGRKRRLPQMMLPEYEFEWADGFVGDLDPLSFDSKVSNDVPLATQDKYWKLLKSCRGYSAKEQVKDRAYKEGIRVIDNGVKIADATRQCVNARIQGSAADLTKLAMIELHNNARLKELGFRLLIPVHDEVIAECPQANMAECSKLLADTMSKAAEQILEMPIKCDVEITREWYGEAINED